jgi:two-component system LytT family response regulator
MNDIVAIIVEDEFHPRQMLLNKLEQHFPAVKVAAECETAETALQEILRLKPDLIFLDIQLPDKNGLWLADRLIQEKCESFTPPEIIFTTGYIYSEYLLEAFRLAAVDYLVKPVKPEDLIKAVNRYRERAGASTGIQNLADAIRQEKLLKFRNLNGMLLVQPEDIAYVKADSDYARMFLANGDDEEIFERLGTIEYNLPKEIFARAGRSYIINLRYIRKINTRNSTVVIATPRISRTIKISEGGLKQIKNLI